MSLVSGWASGLAGGVMIGAAAVLLLGSIGRIAGISGIASGAVEGPRGDRAWRVAFLAGMMFAGAVVLQFGQKIYDGTPDGLTRDQRVVDAYLGVAELG